MPAVTVNSRKTDQPGARKHRFFNVSGNNGDTLNTRLRVIHGIGYNDTTITSVTFSGGTLTFNTAGGAFANVQVTVIGN